MNAWLGPALGRLLLAGSGWLTDDDGRRIAAEVVHQTYPQACYSTYRKEFIEDSILGLRRNMIENGEINRRIFVYDVAFDQCLYVEPVGEAAGIRIAMVDHEVSYGIVAVDRVTGQAYWFGRDDREAAFQRLVVEQQLALDIRSPLSFFRLYRRLVWGGSEAGEVMGFGYLRRLVESNFQSAYSPGERDEKWRRKFESWWRRFRSQHPRLELATKSELRPDGVMIQGFSFRGFVLTVPRSVTPPRGEAAVMRWSLLLRSDGSTKALGSTVIFTSR